MIGSNYYYLFIQFFSSFFPSSGGLGIVVVGAIEKSITLNLRVDPKVTTTKAEKQQQDVHLNFPLRNSQGPLATK